MFVPKELQNVQSFEKIYSRLTQVVKYKHASIFVELKFKNNKANCADLSHFVTYAPCQEYKSSSTDFGWLKTELL